MVRAGRAAVGLALACWVLAACTDSGDGGQGSTTTTAAAAPAVLRTDGLGPLRLGMTREEAEATGLVGTFEHLCDVPPNAVAPLVAPLDGTVGIDERDGKVASIALAAGETAEGVAPTAARSEIEQVYGQRSGFEVDVVDGDDLNDHVVVHRGAASYTFVFEEGAARASFVAVPAPTGCA